MSFLFNFSSNSNGGGGGSDKVAQPTRAHWIPDSKSAFCSIPDCAKPFSFLERRHHCRRCGEAVCQTHFGASLRLNSEAVPDENGFPSEVCDDCFLTYQRRKVKDQEREREIETAASPQRSEFLVPEKPEELVLPDTVLVAPETGVFLVSILSHLSEVFDYFSNIKRTLKNCNDSTLKREYLAAEKDRFDQMLTSLLEHEKSIMSVMPHIFVPELASYLEACLKSIQPIKNWIGSTEIYMLRAGKGSPTKILGLLPEEDFALVEERVHSNELHAERIMGKLFDVGKDEREKMMNTLTWIKARMKHDYHEYLLIPGTEMESFIQRLEKSFEYIDMYLEMCTDNKEHESLVKTVEKYEATYQELIQAVNNERRELTPDDINQLKSKLVDLLRDVSICKGLLQKSAATKTNGSTMTVSALMERIAVLEALIAQLEEKVRIRIRAIEKEAAEKRKAEQNEEMKEGEAEGERQEEQEEEAKIEDGLPRRENFYGRAAEMYQSLQVQRATNLNRAIESEMFGL